MTRAEVIAAVLSNHESRRWADDKDLVMVCQCGTSLMDSATGERFDQRHRAHLVAALVSALEVVRMSHDPKFDSPEMAAFDNMPLISGDLANLCNECNRPVPEDDAGPSCGAHALHVECAPWFHCHECYLMRAEIP